MFLRIVKFIKFITFFKLHIGGKVLGRTKGSKNKKTKNVENYENHESRNITSFIVTIIGIILIAIIVFGNVDGSFSKIVANFFGGLFGFVKYLVPLAITAVGIYGIFKGKGQMVVKLIQTTILLVIISSFFSWPSFQYNSEESFWSNLLLDYQNGISLIDGGLLGGLIITPIWYMLGSIPTLIILIALAILFFVFVTGIRFDTMLIFIKDSVVDLIDIIKDKMGIMSQRKEKVELEEKYEYIYEESEQDIEDDDVEEPENEIEEINKEEYLELEQKKKEAQEKLVKSGLFKTQPKEEVEEQEDIIEELEQNKLADDEDYVFPDTKLLIADSSKKGKTSSTKIKETAEKLQNTLDSFHVKAKVINVSQGPSVTRYELQPAVGVKVSQITNLADDIALNLAASNIRIEAPIPGKAAIGIELPNETKNIVTLREMLETKEFKNAKSKLSYALGRDITGKPIISNIVDMPHMLISGATGSGKSVCINSIIMSILFKAKPSEVRFLMIDPKVVELVIYDGIPHLLVPVVTDPKKAAGALNWAVNEMVERYNLFALKGVKDIEGYNALLKKEDAGAVLPQIVIIIDELADLMMVAKNDVEDAICRLAQMARATGMHLVIATQRPSVDVITGIIKANIPSRIAFSVSSQIDSRTILDTAGAEKLLGKGDMLYAPIVLPKPIRLQGPYVSLDEITNVVEFIKDNTSSNYNEDIIDKIEKSTADKPSNDMIENDVDNLLMIAIDLVVEAGQASTSMLQRRLKVGYARAGRIIDQMEVRGIISGYDGSKPRQVLISKDELAQLKMGNNNIVETNIKQNNEMQEEIYEENVVNNESDAEDNK